MRDRCKAAVAATLLVFFLVIPLSRAQGTTGSGTTTGSGSVAGPFTLSGSIMIDADHAKLLPDFRAAILGFERAQTQYIEERAAYLHKRAENTVQCRIDIRRSNRDTKFPTEMRCFRADLTLRRSFLANQRGFVSGVPGVTDAIRSAALQRLDALLDAVNTVISAIDTGVYDTIDDLLEAKRNLTQKYLAPLSNALVALRADRLFTWSIDILQDLETVTHQAEQTPASLAQWNVAVSCVLQQASTLLKGVAADGLIVSAETLLRCVNDIQVLSAPSPATGSGATS